MDKANSAPTKTINRSLRWRRILGNMRDGWLHLTSSGWDLPGSTWHERELHRRSKQASWVILFVLIGDALAAPISIDDPRTAITVATIAVGTILAAFLNRRGYITAAAWLLTGIITGALLFSVTPEANVPGGGLDVDALPAYDLLAVGTLVLASMLKPSAGLLLVPVNIVLMYLDYSLQPHSPYLHFEINYLYGGNALIGAVALLARPVGLSFLVAAIAWIWVRGVQEAALRANLAEERLTLERRYAAQEAHHRAEYELFAQQITAVIVSLANNQAAKLELPADHPFAPNVVDLNAHLRAISTQLQPPAAQESA